jgi:NAD(P)H dehydrogenase (quinone)
LFITVVTVVLALIHENMQVRETLPDEVLEKMHAPPKPDVPFITVADLVHADGFVFGFPTR